MTSVDERRQFPRLKAPVFFQTANYFEGKKKTVLDVSVGGARIYSDESVREGEALDLELFLPDGASVVCTVRVAWVTQLPRDGVARYEVGLQFLNVPRDALQRLDSVLEKDPEG